MSCPSCSHENPPGSRFCLQCGGGLAQRCSACVAELPPGSRFCNRCGAPLDAQPAAPPAPGRAPRDYTPAHLAERILNERSALEGERKQVTVLFADVQGSVALSEQVDAEEWHQILDRFFRILTDGVHRFEGTVNQYTGDGIMALFGAPLALEDHAQRACYAALQLNESLRAYANELRSERGLSFATRLALNAGEVVVGKIGDDLRMDYTAQGATVGVAARVQELAEPGRVYVAEAAARLVHGYFELREVGSFDLRGVSGPVRVCELVGASGTGTRLQVARRRGLSPFVARQREFAALENALAQTLEGGGQVVGVVGEAGVGKSRLCLEFVERARTKGIPVYEAHCPPHGKAVPLLPIQELLRRTLGVGPGDAPRTARERIAGYLLLLDESFREDLPLVFDFLDVPDPQSPPPELDAETRQRRLLSLLRRTVQMRSEHETVIHYLDDLHWIDPASDDVLAQLVDVVAGTRTMLLVNFRPEYVPSWRSRSHFLQLPLAPLGEAAIEELLGALLGGDPSVAPLVERIRARAGGRPFFAEELVQSLIESGALEGARGAYRAPREVGELGLPDTVQAVLAARIDRLPASARRVLRTASVIGPRFRESVLARVSELPEVELSAALSKLETNEFVFAESLHPEPEYAFKHPLTQEVAYTGQLKAERARLHRAVADTLSEGPGRRPAATCALLAHHRENADEPLEAARWHARAAIQYAVSGSLRSSKRHWLRARKRAAAAPESPEALRLRLTACGQSLGTWAGGMTAEEEEALYAEGRELGRRLGDNSALALIAGAYGQVWSRRGDAWRCLELARECERLIDETDNRGAQFMARATLARALGEAGRLDEALRVCEQSLADYTDSDTALGEGEVGASPLLGLLMVRLVAFGLQGRFADAEATASRFFSLRSEGRVAGSCQVLLAEVRYLAGDLDGCRRLLEKYAAGDRDDLLQGARSISALIDLLSKRWKSVREQRLPEDWGLSMGFFSDLHRIGRRTRSALASLRLGEAQTARGELRELLAEAVGRRVPLDEIEPRLALARIAIAAGAGREGVEPELARVVECIDDCGARAYGPWVHEVRAELAAAEGDECARERELREAQRLYAEMGAAGHAQRLARELGA